MLFRLKKITALLLVLCLLTAAVPQAGAFSDITNPDIALAAASLQSLGIAQGTSDTTYSPNTPLTRAQFCTFAVRALGMEDSAPSAGAKDAMARFSASRPSPFGAQTVITAAPGKAASASAGFR